ncbi:MAG: hypothetical protein R3Y06_11425, partial [Faecalibacterium sp.]
PTKGQKVTGFLGAGEPLSRDQTLRTVCTFCYFLVAKSKTRCLGKRQRYSAVEHQKEKQNPAVPLKKSLRIGTQNQKSIAIIQATLEKRQSRSAAEQQKEK